MTSAVFLIALVLPLVCSQSYHWGACPDPKIQPNFNIELVHTHSISSGETPLMKAPLSSLPSLLETVHHLLWSERERERERERGHHVLWRERERERAREGASCTVD